MSSIPNVSAAAQTALHRIEVGSRQPVASKSSAKAHQQAQDFEAMMLGNMFQNMFTGIGKQGPLGNSTGVGIWRSFLTDAYAKDFAKSGGIGIADQVYKSLMQQQQARAAARTEVTQ